MQVETFFAEFENEWRKVQQIEFFLIKTKGFILDGFDSSFNPRTVLNTLMVKMGRLVFH